MSSKRRSRRRKQGNIEKQGAESLRALDIYYIRQALNWHSEEMKAVAARMYLRKFTPVATE